MSVQDHKKLNKHFKDGISEEEFVALRKERDLTWSDRLRSLRPDRKRSLASPPGKSHRAVPMSTWKRKIWTGHDYPPQGRGDPVPWMSVQDHKKLNKHFKDDRKRSLASPPGKSHRAVPMSTWKRESPQNRLSRNRWRCQRPLSIRPQASEPV
jgi:hypothetical protein